MKNIDKQTFDELQKELEELKKLPGKQRGEHLKYIIDYIKSEKGEEGLQKIENTLQRADFDIGEVDKIRDTQWVSESIARAFLVAATRIFEWDEKKVFEIGRQAMIQSSVVKIFLNFFLSPEKTIRKGIKQWRNHFSRGELELKTLDKDNKKGVLVLKDFPTHHLDCVFFQGFFKQMLEVMTGSNHVDIQETKCMNRGDDYHEFSFQWQ